MNRARGAPGTGVYERIYGMISRVPPGKVATYGQIAKLVGGCSARQVGYALAALQDDSGVPWQRIINSEGRISFRSAGENHDVQRRLLEREGVQFNREGRIDLLEYRWHGPESEREMRDLFDD
ncbi:MAG: MGMT family protein [Gammaproteobacteria bacterium]|nr:MGMT family protein [Gammaproteobacteria bacterium]